MKNQTAQGDDLSRIKQTIRQLLNLAEDDGAFDQEAENALRFARRLMMRHDLDQTDCEEKRDVHRVAAAADVEYGMKHCNSEAAGLSKWEESLATTITRTIGTVRWYKEEGRVIRKSDDGRIQFSPRTGLPQKCTRLVFYGPEGDCVDAVAMFDEWRQIVLAMARLKHGGCFRGPGRSYCDGFADSLRKVWRKISEEEAQAERAIDAPEAKVGDRQAALMIINSKAIALEKKKRAADWLKTVANVKLHSLPANTSRKHYSAAYADGQADGRKANLDRSRRKRLEG